MRRELKTKFAAQVEDSVGSHETGINADTVLELKGVLSGLQLTTVKHAKLMMITKHRVVRVSDNTDLAKFELTYSSPGRELDEWSAEDGRNLQEAIKLAYVDIANQAVTKLLEMATR